MSMAHVVTGKLFAPIYKKEGVDPNVLSRTMEDCGTLGGTLMPWHTNAVYFTGTLGVLYSQYIPWVLLCYIVPILSLIAAATGYGIWYVDPETGKRIPKESHRSTKNHNFFQVSTARSFFASRRFFKGGITYLWIEWI